MRKEKRRYILIAIINIIVFIIGLYIYKTNTGILTCTTKSLENGMMYENEYIVTYKNRKVSSLKSVEKITFNDEGMLEEYKETLEDMYKPYNELEYYQNDLSIRNNTLNSVTEINYKKINLKELIKLDNTVENLLDEKDNVLVTKLRKQYIESGAKCHYKN